MGLSDITAESVSAAIAEFDQLGRIAFLAKYGFGPSRTYFLLHDGVAYDSKAICGAAHGYLTGSPGPLGPSDFSGGDKTVKSRLEKLGFAVIGQPQRIKVGAADGGRLDAECELHRLGGAFTVTLLSRGGAKGSADARNPDYTTALRVLLSRSAAAGMKLDAVILDTTETRHLPVSDRLLLPDTPVELAMESEMDSLVSRIAKASASSKIDGKGSGGNRTKQIQLVLSGGQPSSLDDFRSTVIIGEVTVFVLTWNPKVWAIPDHELAEVIGMTAAGEPVLMSWSTGNRKSGISAGDHVVLLRQGVPDRGIVALGTALGPIHEGSHFADGAKVANYVDVEWREWVPTDERLPVELLQQVAVGTNWSAVLSSGNRMSPADGAAILKAWGATGASAEVSIGVTGDESVAGLPEGAKKTVTVNKYERSPRNRRLCLLAHGTACKVCEIDFGVAYGGVGAGFIHVHHVTPVSSLGGSYAVDPETDLVPVCPNCHAMLHHGVKEPRSIEELRSLLGK